MPLRPVLLHSCIRDIWRNQRETLLVGAGWGEGTGIQPFHYIALWWYKGAYREQSCANDLLKTWHGGQRYGNTGVMLSVVMPRNGLGEWRRCWNRKRKCGRIGAMLWSLSLALTSWYAQGSLTSQGVCFRIHGTGKLILFISQIGKGAKGDYACTRIWEALKAISVC